ncbi:MAG TPA: glycosyltransferase family 2 protein, partial [Candidatus Limnocylindria bacterium]
MASRVFAASFLLVSAVVAWITITVPIAARALQLGVLLSMVYVGYLAWRGMRVMRAAIRGRSDDPPAGAADDPFVSIVIPARNEAPVIAGSVTSLAAQRYGDGAPRFDILVVDDGSTDGTGEAAATAAAATAAAADHVRVVRREPGPGPRTKASVLVFAQPSVRGEVIGVVDADTRVEEAFLARVMAAWRRDPAAAAIQVARRPRNAGRSWLTAAQAEEQLMDMASQCGRRATDGTAELRGNGMFVRRDVLETIGGWNVHALTEDLDLSTRLSAAGHHVTLAPEVAVEEEAVETLGALWHQRLRWAEG